MYKPQAVKYLENIFCAVIFFLCFLFACLVTLPYFYDDNVTPRAPEAGRQIEVLIGVAHSDHKQIFPATVESGTVKESGFLPVKTSDGRRLLAAIRGTRGLSAEEKAFVEENPILAVIIFTALLGLFSSFIALKLSVGLIESLSWKIINSVWKTESAKA